MFKCSPYGIPNGTHNKELKINLLFTHSMSMASLVNFHFCIAEILTWQRRTHWPKE